MSTNDELPLFAPRGREVRLKAIKSALVELVTGKLMSDQARAILIDNGCDEAEANALISSAPKTIQRRRKPNFKGEIMPLDLQGGRGMGLTK